MTVDDWDGKGPLDEEESVYERVRRAIEASSLGTEAARAVRAQVGPGVGDALLDRVRARLAAEGLPGGAAPAAMEPAARLRSNPSVGAAVGAARSGPWNPLPT